MWSTLPWSNVGSMLTAGITYSYTAFIATNAKGIGDIATSMTWVYATVEMIRGMTDEMY